MRLKKIIENSIDYYKEPALVLVPHNERDLENFPDDEILKMFSDNSKTQAIVICEGSRGDIMNDSLTLRAFIFSARKTFSAGTRPLIIIYTRYHLYELKDIVGWFGVKSEILQYGNVLLKVGRPHGSERLYFNPVLGIKLRGKHQEVYSFTDHQYE